MRNRSFPGAWLLPLLVASLPLLLVLSPFEWGRFVFACSALSAVGWLFLQFQGAHVAGAPGFAVGLVVGQCLAMLYLYARLWSVRWLSIPGVGGIEVLALAGGLLGYALFRGFGRSAIRDLASPGAATIGACTLALSVFFFLRFGSLDTLSSDPDIHAYLARQILGSGAISYYYPRSEVPLFYPSAFCVQNLLWGRLCGWNAVQLVNLAPYLQVFLIGTAALTLLQEALSPRRRWVFAFVGALFVFAILNPAWLLGRENSEGTARLAHNGLLLLPLFAAWIAPGGRVLWGIIGAAVSLSIFFNPAHLLPAIFVACASLWISGLGRREWIFAGVGFIVSLFLVSSVDPYFHWVARSFADHSARFTGTTTPIPTQAGTLLSLPGFSDALSATLDFLLSPASFLGFQVGSRAERILYAIAFLILIGKASMAAVVRRWIWAWVGTMVAIQFIHYGLVLFVNQSTLPAHLFTEYTRMAGEQMARAFAAPLAAVILISAPWRRWLLIACLIFTAASVRQLQKNTRFFLPALRSTTLGHITPDALQVIRMAEEAVPAGERVLLIGRRVDLKWEKWIMPEGAARAVGLYSSLPTAFYFGVDHPDFSAQAYSDHVEKGLDLKWLGERGVRWVLTEGDGTPFRGVGETAASSGNVRLIRLP